MPSLTDRKLTITHQHPTKTAKVTARCDVNFNAAEVALMKTAPTAKWYKLKCKLKGDDPIWDDNVYNMPTVHYFPNGTSNSLYNNVTFEATVGEGLLNEDIGEDEIYAEFTLTPLAAGNATGKSNVVSHSF